MTSEIRRTTGSVRVKKPQAEFVIDTLEKYEQPLTRYAMRLLSGDLSMARDVVQHTFLKLCESDFRSIEKRIAPWLYTVCRNRAIDKIRGRNSEEQLDLVENIQPHRNGVASVANPSGIAEEAEFVEQIRLLIDELPESQREIVELWAQGFSSNEVGEIIGKKSGAVRIALHRAIGQLKNHPSVVRWKKDDEVDEVDDDDKVQPGARLATSPLNNRLK